MPRAYSLSFKPAKAPIQEPVTKFGGQPTWLQQPQWPVSRKSGQQMKFICQIVIYPEIFGACVGKMAYIFISDVEQQALPTWDPTGGENAVIIQPGHPPQVNTRPSPRGPSLYEFIEVPGQTLLEPRPCEFLVDVFQRTDPDFIEENHRIALDEPSFALYSKQVEGNKIGGTPYFLQEDQLPRGGGHLLMQLDSANIPFSLNFGDCGVGYVFISPDGSQGRFLFQSY